MGIIRSSSLGNCSGTTGDIVFYTVAGQGRSRRRPDKYKDRKSPEQVAQRTRVKGISTLYHNQDLQLLTYWKELTKGTLLNGYNMFMSKNIRNLTAEGTIAEPGLLKITEGILPLPQQIEAVITPEKTIQIKWDIPSEGQAGYNDCLQIAVHAPSNKKNPKIEILESTFIQRNKGYYEFHIPDTLEMPVHFYVFFKARYTNDISTNCYLGSLEA